MAQEIRQFTATIPANTPKAAPVRIDVSFPARIVRRVEIKVPPGPSGLAGFAIQNSGLTIIPYGSDAYIVTADEVIGWDLDEYITSGSWQVQGYNTDVFPHSIYVRFLLDTPTPPPSPPPVALPSLVGMTSATPPDTAALIAEAEASVGA